MRPCLDELIGLGDKVQLRRSETQKQHGAQLQKEKMQHSWAPGSQVGTMDSRRGLEGPRP